jgi:hypothetical protein
MNEKYQKQLERKREIEQKINYRSKLSTQLEYLKLVQDRWGLTEKEAHISLAAAKRENNRRFNKNKEI